MLESIEELRTFRRVINEGSLSAAARSLGLSANAVSRRLAQLESRLGLRLAERTTRRFTLTDEGRRFAVRCERILREIDDAEEDLRPATSGLRGLVRVAIHPELLRGDFLAKVGDLLAEHSELRVHLLARSVPEDPVRLGVDMGVWPGDVPLQSVVAKRVVEVRWVLACSSEYAERRGVPRRPSELIEHECLRALKRRGESHWALRDRKGNQLEVPVGGQFESDDNETLRAALFAGIGIGLRPRGEVKAEAAAGRLVHVLPSYTFQDLPVHLVAAPGRLRLRRIRAVARLIEVGIQGIA